MRFGFGHDLPARRVMRLPSLTQQAAAILRSAGMTGALYNPHDPATMFADDAGTTPAVINGVVGRQLDISGNGFHRTRSSTPAKGTWRGTPIGASLIGTTNATLGSGVTGTAAAGYVATASTANPAASWTVSLTAGRVYRLDLNLTGVTGGSIQPYLATGATVLGTSRTSSGVWTEYFVATAAHTRLRMVTTGFTGNFEQPAFYDASADVVRKPFWLEYGDNTKKMSVTGLDLLQPWEQILAYSAYSKSSGAFAWQASAGVSASGFNNALDASSRKTTGVVYSGATTASAVSLSSYTDGVPFIDRTIYAGNSVGAAINTDAYNYTAAVGFDTATGTTITFGGGTAVCVRNDYGSFLSTGRELTAQERAIVLAWAQSRYAGAV